MRQVSIALLGVVLSAGVLGGCGQGEAPAAASTPAAPLGNLNVVRIPLDSPQLKQIRVEPIRQVDMPSDELVAPGRVAMNPNRVSRVLPPVSGRVLKVLVKLGDHVEQGQALLEMESPDGDAAVSADLQAQSTERQTRAALQKAEGDLRRATDLYEHKAVAEKDFLQAQNDVASAKSGYEIAQAVREQTSRKLQLLELKPTEFHQAVQVRAPLTGQVLEVNVAPGEYRAAISFHTDTTAPLMTIADLSTVWVSSDVPEPFIPLIHVGEPVAITLVAFPDQILSGRVARIGDVLDAQTRTLKVHVELPNPVGRFRPEMYGSIRHSGPTRRTLVVPDTALLQEYGRSIVFVERGPGQFERREVTTGVRTGTVVAVSEGLAPDERVVVDGAILLKGQ
jgi:cobalt-zinc-cadmium efflux system membrane fusion protein